MDFSIAALKVGLNAARAESVAQECEWVAVVLRLTFVWLSCTGRRLRQLLKSCPWIFTNYFKVRLPDATIEVHRIWPRG
jgi:hypothetical protein